MEIFFQYERTVDDRATFGLIFVRHGIIYPRLGIWGTQYSLIWRGAAYQKSPFVTVLNHRPTQVGSGPNRSITKG